ncbi:hypothetical protein F5Y19DRAFT_469377 [Xylariaceae sp. FL1651]|nr:hypothetical protein F5Y19DRAFT_469377 [Xylariaceae sp. FL1651]
MESFSLAAQHAGALQHVHIVRFDPSAVAAARELRIAITVMVAGWKGSPHHRPRIIYPLSADSEKALPPPPTEEVYQTTSSEPPITARHRKQRRISRNQHGLRVSRCTPARASRDSICAEATQPSRMQMPESTEHPYWGTLEPPRASYRSSMANHAIGNDRTDIRDGDFATTELANDKTVPGGKHLRDIPEPLHSQGQKRKTPKREKRFGLADPVAWDVINRSLTQQQRLSSIVVPDGPPIGPVHHSQQNLDVASRTSSQRRALKHFTRELEKYADATSAAGRAPVITPTASESKASYHTVKPLVPYKDEFRAAGLAVTSAEQSRKLSDKADAQASLRRSKQPEISNVPLQASNKLDGHDYGSSETNNSTSCTSSGSYVHFSSHSGHMSHLIETFVPRKAKAKRKHGLHARRHLLSWFLKKPPSKLSNHHENHLPIPIQEVKGGQVQLDDLSSSRQDRRRPQHRSHKPTMQTIPETPFKPIPALPIEYVTPKKGPSVELAPAQFDPKDQSHYQKLNDEQHHSVADASGSLGQIGLHGKRDITRALLPRPCLEPIETIEEETETILCPADNNIQNRFSSPIKENEKSNVTEGTCQQHDAVSSVTQDSSILSLPFPAKFAANTASSLQRALDAACQRLDEEDRQVENPSDVYSHLPSQLEKTKRIAPTIPAQNSRHRISRRVLTRRPRSTDKFIYVKRSMPRADTFQSIPKPLPPGPVTKAQVMAGTCSKPISSQPSRKPPAIPRRLSGRRANPVAELAKAEEMLKDLDVFLSDYDDADIEDRDVIKGLQVAIHAAADDLYDGYIRHKTGLRIRRFLADLKSFDIVNELSTPDQPARQKRAESRRLQHIQDRKSRH